MIKKLILLFLVLLSALPFTACTDEHTYAEFTLSAPDKYFEYETDDYDLAFTDSRATVGITRISLASASVSGLDVTYTPADFARFYLDYSGKKADIQQADDIPYYTYVEAVMGVRYYCLMAFYRTEGAYFIVACMVDENRKDSYSSEFIEIIASAKMQKGN